MMSAVLIHFQIIPRKLYLTVALFKRVLSYPFLKSKIILGYPKILIVVVVFFFYLGFLSRTLKNDRTAGEGGGHFFKSSLPLSPASQTLRH